MRPQAIHMFGPAGLLEQDDGENWSQSTRVGATASPAARLGQHLSMGLGHDEVTVDAAGERYIEGLRQRARPALALSLLDRVDGGARLGQS